MTKTTLFATVACLALAAASAPAHAQTTNSNVLLATSGAWEVDSAISYGRAVCVLTTHSSDDGKGMAVTVAADEPMVNLRAVKMSWQIPAGAVVPMFISFDQEVAWQTIDASRVATGHSVAYNIRPDALRAFVHGFTAGSVIHVGFGGNEAPWSFDLNGTTGAWAAFMDCAKRVNPDAIAQLLAPVPTQPYAVAPPATQPFAAPAPSQPYKVI